MQQFSNDTKFFIVDMHFFIPVLPFTWKVWLYDKNKTILACKESNKLLRYTSRRKARSHGTMYDSVLFLESQMQSHKGYVIHANAMSHIAHKNASQ